MLDYSNLFVLEKVGLQLEPNIMHMEVCRQSNVDETSPEWIV